MRKLRFWLLILTTGVVGADGTPDTAVPWCPYGLPRLFPARPAWLGAPPPASVGALRSTRVSVRGGQVEDFVGLLDQFPNGSDAPVGTVGPGQTRTFRLSSRGQTVLFAVVGGDRHYRAFRWQAGRTPAAVTVTLSRDGVRLSVPAAPLTCQESPPS